MSKQPLIRYGKIEDLPSIVNIYNQAIRSRQSTGDLEEYLPADRVKWFNKYSNDNYPIYVVEIDNNVVGYCTLSPYRPGRKAMSEIAEISFYIHFDHHQKALGTALVHHAINDCQRIEKKHLIAILLDINKPSIGLLQKFNFTEWGHLPEIISIEGKTYGHLIYGLSL